MHRYGGQCPYGCQQCLAVLVWSPVRQEVHCLSPRHRHGGCEGRLRVGAALCGELLHPAPHGLQVLLRGRHQAPTPGTHRGAKVEHSEGLLVAQLLLRGGGGGMSPSGGSALRSEATSISWWSFLFSSGRRSLREDDVSTTSTTWGGGGALDLWGRGTV